MIKTMVIFLGLLGATCAFADARQLTAGSDNSCYLSQGKVKCEGREIPELNHPTQLVQTYQDACAITADGVKCWKREGGFYAVPDEAKKATLLSASYAHTCGLVGDQILCWTQNGPTGLIKTGVRDLRVLAAGWDNSCMISANGLECWDDHGKEIPLPGSMLPRASFVAVGPHWVTCAIVDQALLCWGNSNSPIVKHFPPALRSERFQKVSIGYVHACAVTVGGKVFCWGDEKEDMLDDYLPARKLAVPADLTPATEIAVGLNHSCALTKTGPRCWGGPYVGRVKNTPRPFIPAFSPIRALSAGTLHSCAIIGWVPQVQCWGSNDYGQSEAPKNLKSPLKVAAGHHSTCALFQQKGTQQATCWGEIDSVLPDLKNPRLIAVGRQACATTDEGVRCWHKNPQTQVLEEYSLPSKLAEMKDVVSLNADYQVCAASENQVVCEHGSDRTALKQVTQVVTGVYHACASTAQGVTCWPTTGLSDSPVGFDLTDQPAKISSGPSYSCALLNGQIQCKGRPALKVPKNLRSVSQFSVGRNHGCAVASGRLTCWGADEENLGF